MAVRLSALHFSRQPFTPRKIPGTDFSYGLSLPQGYRAGSIRSMTKVSNLIGTRTCDLPACSILLQPITLPRVLSWSDRRVMDDVRTVVQLWIVYVRNITYINNISCQRYFEAKPHKHAPYLVWNHYNNLIPVSKHFIAGDGVYSFSHLITYNNKADKCKDDDRESQTKLPPKHLYRYIPCNSVPCHSLRESWRRLMVI
jgi:hypothetical protein